MTPAAHAMHVLEVRPPGSPGRAPALVLVHGAGGDHTVWGEQVDSLRGRLALLAPDLPGHGRSPRVEPLGIESYASVLADRLARASGRPVLAGHSMGGAVCLTLALERPERWSGLVLVGTSAKLGVSPRILQIIARDPAGAVELIARTAYSDSAPREMVEQGAERLAMCPPEVLLADFESCNRFDVRDRIGDLRLPTLILCGAEDRLTFPKYSEWMSERIPGARLEIVPGAGHLVMIERPSAVSDALRRFVEEVSASAEPPASGGGLSPPEQSSK